ncbi:MAG: transposase [Acidobacteria bacterium]|nr:transposase [Acidobacteriota bacterium]
MIAESRSKVKTILQQIVNVEERDLTKPIRKFIVEGVIGMLISGTANLTEMARSLTEPISLKQTVKRLRRMSLNPVLLPLINRLCLREAKRWVTRETIFALDSGDISHVYGKEFESIARLKDGSTGKISNGHNPNQITGYDREKKTTFPILLDLYSTVRHGFESANKEAWKLVREVVKTFGTAGLWVMDRGYDSKGHFKEWYRLGIEFIVRACKTRDVWIRNVKQNILDAGNAINRRYKYNKHGRFGYCKVMIPVSRNGKSEFLPFTLIAYKDNRNKEIILFITNGHIRSSKIIRKRITAYFRRWSIEEGYRFEKQGFGIEKATVRRFSRIQTLVGLSLLSWVVLARISEKERLKAVVLESAAMEKVKQKDRPRFLYYQLLKGVQQMFRGIGRIFRFRSTRISRHKARWEAIQRPLFDWPSAFLEVV